MTETTQGLGAVILLAMLSSSAGFYIASKKPDWYTQDRLRFLAAMSTGLLLSLISFVLLPHSFATPGLSTPLSLVLGFMTILFVETYISPKLNFFDGKKCDHDHAKTSAHKHHPAQAHQHHLISHQAACSAVGCLIVCAFFDGFEIQTAFSLNPQVGLLTVLGLLFHVIPDGVLASSIALSGGMKRKTAIIISTMTGSVLLLGALVSITLRKILPVEEYMLPFATGVLLYLTITHLLPMGIKHKRGFIIMAVTSALYIGVQYFIKH